jgi:hypothetical protein
MNHAPLYSLKIHTNNTSSVENSRNNRRFYSPHPSDLYEIHSKPSTAYEMNSHNSRLGGVNGYALSSGPRSSGPRIADHNTSSEENILPVKEMAIEAGGNKNERGGIL